MFKMSKPPNLCLVIIKLTGFNPIPIISNSLFSNNDLVTETCNVHILKIVYINDTEICTSYSLAVYILI